MAELVKYKLRNGRFINTDEDGAKELAASEEATAAEGTASGKKLEETLAQVEETNGQIAALTAENEELKGELSVYKEKIDEALSGEAVEAAATAMVEEKGEADEIIENVLEGTEKDEDKEKIKNSITGLRGEKLQRAVLTAVGVKCENMSPEAVKGAFKAHHQLVKNGVAKRVVAGTKVMNTTQPDAKALAQKAQNSVKRMWGKKVE